MIDELDLAFEDHGRGRSRHRRSSQGRPSAKKKKKRRSKSGLALILTLAMLGCLGGGAYFAYDKVAAYFVTPDYDGTGAGDTVQIEVKQGDLLSDIGNTLVKAGVVKSAKAFINAADLNKAATGIQPGFYTVHKQQSAASAILELLDLKNRIVKGITIPENLISIQIYALLAEKLKLPIEDFKKAAADPVKLGVPASWFKRLDGKKAATTSIEGFLYPSTYEFPPNVTAEGALKQMVKQFLDVTDSLHFVDTVQAKLGGVSPYEALIAASIAQAEAVDTKDLGPVARVLYNRVYKDFPCNCLQIDSAVNYWLRVTGKLPKDSSQILASEQHNLKDPYNTFDAPKFSGFPVGPIGNPAEAALKGAMDPPANNFYFFMTIDKAGTMGYAKDWSGHCANIATAVKNGILSERCQ